MTTLASTRLRSDRTDRAEIGTFPATFAAKNATPKFSRVHSVSWRSRQTRRLGKKLKLAIASNQVALGQPKPRDVELMNSEAPSSMTAQHTKVQHYFFEVHFNNL